MQKSAALRALIVLGIVIGGLATASPALAGVSRTAFPMSVPGGGQSDTTPPSCTFVTNPGPPAQVVFTIQDTGSGLAEVLVTRSDNALTAVPPFVPGTTNPVIVSSTRINQTQPMRIEMRITDGAGNVTLCQYPPADSTPPSCTFVTNPGPPTQVVFTIQDTGSGLAEVLVTRSDNALTAVPPFVVGTTAPVVATSTRIDQTQPMRIEIRVTDQAGNVRICQYPPPDTTDPECRLSVLTSNYIEVRLRDPESGVASVNVDVRTNLSVRVPAITPGTNAELVVTATRINRTQAARLQLSVTDVAGNVTVCDPVLATLRITRAGKPTVQTYAGIPRFEHRLTIKALRPGLMMAVISANGRSIRIDLRGKRIVRRSIIAALNHGRNNKVTVKLYGARGAAALIALTD